MLKRFQSLLLTILIFSAFQSLSLASEKTYLFKLRSEIAPLTNPTLVGNKIVGHREIVENLMANSTVSQSNFCAVLTTNAGVSEYQRYWIANIVKVTGDSARLAALVARADVESAVEDYPIELIAPVESHETTVLTNGPENGLRAINTPEAWSLGLDGTGSLVCNFDTGVDGTHAALLSKYRGNNGGTPDACWFDPYSNTVYPNDNNGHGTHTMGTMVGSDGSDTVGVAPGAEWIAAGVVDRGGGIQRTVSDLLSAFQWAADPDGNPATSDDVPDVVNNSWGIPLGYYPACEATFWDAIDNLEAAGVVCLFAAGNEGSNPGTMRIPADRVTSDFNSFSVGAVDGNSSEFPVAEFSSRGPSACDNVTIKPEITAPGVGIRSTSRTGGYAIMSGTSMATPHVAGAVAILRQFNPQATPTEIKQALMNSAHDLGQAGEDNSYGWGMIDIRRALDYMPIPDNPFLAIAAQTISGDGIANPGESFELGIAVENLGAAAQNATAHLSCSDARVQILSGDLSFGALAHAETTTAQGWEIQFSDDLNLGERVVFDINLSADGWTAVRHITIVVGDLTTSITDGSVLPEESNLISNYPNPFNSSTMIKIRGEINNGSHLEIYDMTGRLVKALSVSGNNLIWNGTDTNGKSVAGGIYFARVRESNAVAVKMVLLK